MADHGVCGLAPSSHLRNRPPGPQVLGGLPDRVRAISQFPLPRIAKACGDTALRRAGLEFPPFPQAAFTADGSPCRRRVPLQPALRNQFPLSTGLPPTRWYSSRIPFPQFPQAAPHRGPHVTLTQLRSRACKQPAAPVSPAPSRTRGCGRRGDIPPPAPVSLRDDPRGGSTGEGRP